MNCSCNNTDDTLIEITAGTTFSISVEFDEDISDFTQALFTIRANYETYPVINKAFNIVNSRSVDISLTKNETAEFIDFTSGKSRMSYIWGLDLIDEGGTEINVFPQTGKPAPLCFVYRHVVEGD